MPSILIIDDDQALCTALSGALRHAGYEATWAMDGLAGLKLYAKKTFDLIISDMIMPNCDGVELIVSLRKMNPLVAIIAMSGGGMIAADNYLKIAASFHVQAVLPKPFTMPRLLEMVSQVLIRQPSLQALPLDPGP